jgi:polysaccharide biosynthesis transport protein
MDSGKETPLVSRDAAELRLVDAEVPYVSGTYLNVDSREFILEKLWRIILKRLWVIAACTAVMATLATISSFRATRLYDAKALITINKQSNDSLGLRDMGASSDDFWDYTVEIETDTKILQSSALAAQVIRDYQLDKNPYFAPSQKASQSKSVVASNQDDTQAQTQMLSKFRSGLRVLPVPRTRIIEIHYTSPDPKLAAAIANAVADTYIQENMRTKFETTMQTSDWISKQLSDLRLKVETSQEKLVRYQRDHGILGIDDKQNIITSKLDALNRELTAAENDRIQKEADYRLISSGDADMISRLEVNPVLDKLRMDRAALQSQYAQMNTTFGPSYPKILELKMQLNDVDRQIAAESARAADRVKNEYLTALQREKLLQRAFESQTHEANKLNESAIEYSILKHDLESSRTLYDGLLERLKEAGVTAGLRSNDIRVIDPARPPLAPSSPNTQRDIGFGILIGIFAGVFLAFVQESMDNTVRTPEQIQYICNWPALGTIPLSSESLRSSYYRLLRKPVSDRVLSSGEEVKEPDLATIVHTRPRSEAAESYRALRTSILLSSLGGPPKTILITSALPQEGKTTTALNSATVLAQRGSRVLLIDADLRRPRIHQILGRNATPGLSNLLTGSATIGEVVQSTEIPNLYCVSSGSIPPHPAELLASDLMRNYLQMWREEFDHIIVDTPPVLSVSDAVMLSAYVESTIVVVRAGKTRKEALRRVHAIFSQVKTRVLGVVINAVNLGSPEHYYYYYGKRYGDSKYYGDADKTDKTETTV